MTRSEDQAPVHPGDVIGAKYRVERVLGAGGMGVVLLATHLDLDQKVAIKFLLPEAAKDPELVERFLREGRASVRLRGVHVVKTIDVGRLENGAPYLVMEFLQGHTLRDALNEHPEGMPLETLCSLMLQACEGVAEAHALGIVHRDLKPENLFVTHGVDGRPLLKVLDFGISKVADESFGGSLTKTNTLFGSPMYMSPEQMRSAKHVDPRADVWSLAVIAYELACGAPPFDADTFYDLCLKVAQDTPIPLAERRPDLPRSLIEGIDRGLRKDIGSRTQNAADLASCFEPYAGPRAAGTTDRLRDVIRASGAAFAALATPDFSNPNSVQSAWGATERLPQLRRRWVPWVVAALATLAIGVGTSTGFRARPATPDITGSDKILPASAFAALAPAASFPQGLPSRSLELLPLPVADGGAPPLASLGAKDTRPKHVTPGAPLAMPVPSAPPPLVTPPPAPPPPTPAIKPPPPNDGFHDERQ